MAVLSTGVAAMSSLSKSYEFDIPRSGDNIDARLTESRNVRSEQLVVMPTEQPAG